MTPPDASAPGRETALPVHAAWRRHRGNFRHDNEDTVLVGDLGTTPAEPSAEAGATRLSDSGAGFVALVCDGVGGGVAGEVASALAARAFVASLRALVEARDPARPVADVPVEERQEWVRGAARAADAAIMEAVEQDRALEGMGTTMTAVWGAAGRLILAQVGDSRLYRLRHGQLRQLSLDQSLVGRMRQSGDLSEQQARRHPLRNIVDQVLGGKDAGAQPVLQEIPLEAGDEFLLCSDGLTDALPDGTLERVLVEGMRETPDALAGRLLEMVLDTSGRDNVSIVLLRAGPERSTLAASLLARAVRAARRRREPETVQRVDKPDADRRG